MPRRSALGLATPTAIMVGSGLGAKRGILFKNAIGLEQAARLDTVVFDKTGTLTRGEPEVVAVAVSDDTSEDALLTLVAAAEGDSEHPLAEAIVKAARDRGLDVPRADAFQAVSGHGALATVAGRRLAIGNARLMQREHVSLDGLEARAQELAGEGRTVVQVAVDERAAGLIAIADAFATAPPPPCERCATSACARSCCPATAARPPSASPARSASTTSSPRCSPPTRRRRWPSSSPPAARSPWSGTTSTTPQPSPKRTSASPSEPAPTWQSRPPTSCSCAPIPSTSPPR